MGINLPGLPAPEKGGNTGPSGGQADASMKMVYLDSLIDAQGSDLTTPLLEEVGSGAVRVDPTEITNAKWNEVVEWASANDYTGLPMGPNLNPDHPRTGITFWQAIKWCNARSEMDGLKPAYYTDPEELLGDFNNDGIIQSAAQQPGGGDQFSPYSNDDTNQNGKWDPGESFTDNNGNGVFDGDEYVDINQNNAYDPGRTMVFRTGLSISVFENFVNGIQPHQNFWTYIDKNASGYRIPSLALAYKLASGKQRESMALG